MRTSPGKIAALLAILLFGPAFADAPPGGPNPVEELWYTVNFSGVPVGVARTLSRKEERGVYYESHMEVQISRLGIPLDLIAREEEWDGWDGRVLSFRVETAMAGTRIVVDGERRGDTLYVRRNGAGESIVERILWEDGAVGESMLGHLAEERFRKGDGEVSFRVFDPMSAEFRRTVLKKRGTATQIIGGIETELLKVERFDGGSALPTVTSWIDGDYTVRKVVFRLMGIEIDIENIDPGEIGTLKLDPNFDVIRQSMIPCEGFPSESGPLEEVTYRLSFPAGAITEIDWRGPNQTVLYRDENVVDLRVSRRILSEERLSDAKLAPYLQDDRFIQSGDPTVRSVADSIARASGKKGAGLAEELALWVNLHIVEKNLQHGFATAVQVLEKREGDCTEHAVLLAALLRAAGIPSRVAVGLAYADGHLVGHMWTEAYVDYWRTYDALDLDGSPTRVRLIAAKGGRAIDEVEMVGAYGVVGGLKAAVRGYRLSEE